MTVVHTPDTFDYLKTSLLAPKRYERSFRRKLLLRKNERDAPWPIRRDDGSRGIWTDAILGRFEKATSLNLDWFKALQGGGSIE